MVHHKNGLDYCDCMDWNEDFKERSLRGANLFTVKEHTTGVSPAERKAWYVQLSDQTPQEIALAKELAVIQA